MSNHELSALGGIIEIAAKRSPEKTAVIHGESRITYLELKQATDAMAVGLWARGYRRGDRVAIYMKNSIEFFIAFYALQKLGVIVAWVNALYRETEARFIIRDSGAKAVFAFDEWGKYNYLEPLTTLKEELPSLQEIFIAGNKAGAAGVRFEDLLASGKGKSLEPVAIDPENDLAMLIYTSGTTGKPKGAMITHCQAIGAGKEFAKGLDATSDDVFIGVLPMSHSYGCGTNLIQPLLLQSTIVLMDAFDVEGAFALIEKEKVTIQNASPVHYILELNHPELKKYDLSSLRAGLIAGQPAPEGLISKVGNELGMYLTSFWGSSEVGPGVGIICPYPSDLDIREKYIGKPVAGTEVKVVDPFTRDEVETGTRGELTLSGWHVLKGYWQNPDETRNQIVDGWLFTGDLVQKDKNGYYRIFGRTKDLINRGGYKIYPLELESLISDHPAVEQVCVVATPNPVLGENICVCTCLKPGLKTSLAEIRDFLKGRIAPHKLPDELCVMPDLPRLPGGVKINKFGAGGVAELARHDPDREIRRKM